MNERTNERTNEPCVVTRKMLREWAIRRCDQSDRRRGRFNDRGGKKQKESDDEG